MTCTRHFLNMEWEHHSWKRRVTFSEYMPTAETNQWGRTVHGECVRCDAEWVCVACGKTWPEGSCVCDKAEGEICPPRLAWLEQQSHQSAGK